MVASYLGVSTVVFFSAVSGSVTESLSDSYLPVCEALVSWFLRCILVCSRRKWFFGGLAEGIHVKQVS